MSATTSVADLSRYRAFQLGTDLHTIVKQTGTNLADVKLIHRRPVLIQELQWRPQSLSSPPQAESVKEVIFSFYDGELFQIVVNYDRYQTEGLTTADMVETISTAYGVAAKPATQPEVAQGRYGDQGEALAQWQDQQYRFDLIRSSYGPSFMLSGVLKRLESQAKSAILEAKRLDDQEAPQREAARLAVEEEVTKARQEKARLANKTKFRP